MELYTNFQFFQAFFNDKYVYKHVENGQIWQKWNKKNTENNNNNNLVFLETTSAIHARGQKVEHNCKKPEWLQKIA